MSKFTTKLSLAALLLGSCTFNESSRDDSDINKENNGSYSVANTKVNTPLSLSNLVYDSVSKPDNYAPSKVLPLDLDLRRQHNELLLRLSTVDADFYNLNEGSQIGDFGRNYDSQRFGSNLRNYRFWGDDSHNPLDDSEDETLPISRLGGIFRDWLWGTDIAQPARDISDKASNIYNSPVRLVLPKAKIHFGASLGDEKRVFYSKLKFSPYFSFQFVSQHSSKEDKDDRLFGQFELRF